MTSDPISRQALDEALEKYTLGESTPEQRAVIADAAQAVLDGRPLDWCVEHRAQRSRNHPWCQEWKVGTACFYESQVRIAVNP